MNEATFDVGAVQLVADSWPADWLTYARESYFPGSGGDRPLRVRYEALSSPAKPEAAPQTRAMLEATGRLSFCKGPDLRGTFDEGANLLEVWATREGSPPRLSLENALRLLLSTWLPYRWGGLMLHASAGVLEGKGVAFAGLSTAGKSTLATGFEETTYLSDDITLLDDLAESPRLIGAPFFGVSGWRGAQTVAPLAALGVLSHGGEQTSVRRLSQGEAAEALLRHVVCFSEDPAVLAAVLARIGELSAAVPVFEVARSLNDSADEVVRRLLEEASC